MTVKNILFAILTLLALASCKKYLDKDPVDRLTPEQAFSTETNLKLYVNSFYLMLPNANNIYQSELTSDQTVRKEVPPYLLPGFSAQSALAFHATASPWNWTNLRNINYFIENNTNTSIPAATRNHYTGIARFFRAYFYYNMIKVYGDVPWYGKTLSPSDPDLYKPRDPRSLVMDSVLSDLNFAVTNIFDTKDASCTQVTRSVALAFKSRVCLFEGTFRKYHNVLTGTVNSWLQEAANAAGTLMGSLKYTLHKTANSDLDYRSLFINETPLSSEILLASVYSNSLRKWHGSNNWYNSLTAGDRLSLNKRFVNVYLNLDGTRFTDNPGYTTIEFQEEVKNRDKRLKQTIRTPATRWSDGTYAGPDFIVTTTGYQILKYSTDDKALNAVAQSFNSIPIMRYAEVLLNYAEAKQELGTLTPADWSQTIGALRTRAGITNTAMPTVADPYLQANFYPGITDAVLLEIRRERSVELVAEYSFRFDDLMRWRLGENIVKSYDGIYVPAKGQILDISDNGAPGAGDVSFVDALPTPQVPGVTYVLLTNNTFRLSNGNSGNLQWLSNTNRIWDTKRYFYPLPPTELLINTNLVQNTGW